MNRFAAALLVSTVAAGAISSNAAGQQSGSSRYSEKITYPQSQGWSQSQMQDWYELSQGSRLAPLSWLEALKNKDGTAFLARQSLERLGYVYVSNRAESLPVGFVLDTTENDPKPWLGFNCSACHTSKLKVGSAEVLIHGGQSMADFQSFINSLIGALAETRKSDAAFATFATAVLGVGATEPERAKLKLELDRWLAFRSAINNTGAGSHWGRGRADAVGVILATTAMVVADPTVPTGQREPLPPSNAPVSYPFVWNANQQARLQHNGIVDNGVNLGPIKVAKIGALIRNWTEALGVFADVTLNPDNKSVSSSIRLDNLLRMEQALAELQSPRWPEAFGKLDEARRARGAVHYRDKCASCHGLLDPADTTTTLHLLDQPASNPVASAGYIYLQPIFDKNTRPKAFEKTHAPSSKFIGTDPGMACNALMHVVPSGRMQGQMNAAGLTRSQGDRQFGERALTTDLLRVLIQNDLKSNKVATLQIIAENQLAAAGERLTQYAYGETSDDISGQTVGKDALAPLRLHLAKCAQFTDSARAFAPDSPVPMYKARPLNGIWASAPYLHNGSVPTLYDLMLPQKERPKSFGYLDGTLDTVKGGLNNASGNPAAFVLRTYDKEGVVIAGNWNGGHEYGTDLKHEQKRDLVEYLKGL